MVAIQNPCDRSRFYSRYQVGSNADGTSSVVQMDKMLPGAKAELKGIETGVARPKYQRDP